MRSAAFFLAILIYLPCLAQYDYKSTLAKRVKAISEHKDFNSGVALSEDFEYFDYGNWSADQDYSEGDFIGYRGAVFQAVKGNMAKEPFTSRSEWRVVQGLHPYLFLRDTAKTEDLRELLRAKNIHVRIYAVAALARRKKDDLFAYVRSNLADTTVIHQFMSDHGWPVRPADIMLWFTMDNFTREQKDELKRVIIKEHRYLDCLREVLMYHNAHPDDYRFIKEIVNEGAMGGFGLIALAKYCRAEDIETIRTGFSTLKVDYWAGYFDFFKAIATCPNTTFKQDLLNARSRFDDADYIMALAAFKDPDCLALLEIISRDRSGSPDERVAVVYHALKKHYHPMYDKLIVELEKKRPTDSTHWDWYVRSTSRWDY